MLRKNSVPTKSEAKGLSEQQMRDLRQIFDWLDYSGDGEIDAPELLVVLRSTSSSASLEQASDLIREVTGGAKKTVSWLEFCQVIERGLQKGDATTAAQMFQLLDTHGSGLLSPEVITAPPTPAAGSSSASPLPAPPSSRWCAQQSSSPLQAAPRSGHPGSGG